jgi:general secretion pathway protein A
MYGKFFFLKEMPFNITPDPKFLYLSKGHMEALDVVFYGIRERRGFILLLGEVGTGKTTLCRTLLDRLNRRVVRSAFILNPLLSGYELLKSINEDFGISVPGTSLKAHVDTLNRFLLALAKQGGTAVVIIDEAQHLSVKALEMIRLLSNLETEKQKLLQIMLVAQPEIKDKLKLPELRPLLQRIVVKSYLKALDYEDTKRYIFKRLAVAGGRGNIKFTSSSLRDIYNFTHGTPRLVNILCDRILMVAFIKEERVITKAIVKKALEDLMMDGFQKVEKKERKKTTLRSVIRFPSRFIRSVDA